jgi:formylglycine-generating enzyme required for sulfatase activity/tRNA A-37 threonylcarbamoyl transferase component Bud32
MAQTPLNQVGHTLGGRYRIERGIAQGGMSTVYKAVDPNLHRTVAVKLIHPHLSQDPEFVRRFEKEAAAVAQLRHPNIIQVYDFDHEGEVYYMVLEFVPGDTLQTWLKRLNSANQRLPLKDTIRIMATVCDAVAYAHQYGMIHRDLKPANVMLNPQGQPILMDFGVAKMLGETYHTATGTVIGTALYMSPEQARSEHLDERTDIYSLGVMLFEMITGQPPFEADSAVVVLMKHVNEPVPDICQLNGDAPDELVAVVEKALAKDPADRYQTASDMAAALRAVGSRTQAAALTIAPSVSQPVRVAPASASASSVAGAAQPARKRNWLPWLVSAATLGVLILALGIGLLFVAWRFARPLVLAQALSLPTAEGMVKINDGVYLVGLDTPDEQHAVPQQIKLNEFWIDQYEVMNSQYAQFLAETGHQPPTSWPDGNIPPGQEAHPVEGVTWELAAAYCTWAKKRLPTEAEWEVAARGPQGLLYPWGDDEHTVELPNDGTYTVGGIPANRSPFGAFDVAGNVWEWVGSPYTPIAEGQRILRGGANGFLKDMAYRLQGDPNVPTMIATAGMRCAADQVRGAAAASESPPPVPLPKGVLFQDEFTDPNSGWPEGEQGTHRFGYHPAAFYHLEVSAPNDHLTIFRELNFADFTAETEALVDHTNTSNGNFRYGLAFRRSGDQYYAFTISPRTQTWQVFKASSAGLAVMAEGTNDSMRGLHATDRLRVDAAGPDFTFYINDQIVAQVNDPDYASGEVGFIVETLDETLVHIHYASLTIRELEAHQAGLLYQDEFTDPASGWPALDQNNHHFGYHPPDYYHVEVSVPNDHVAVSRGPSFDDVIVETEVFVDHTQTASGDFRYGLALRRSGDQYYAFTISPRTQTWQVFKSSSAGLAVMAEGTDDSIQGLNASDKLRVDAAGPDFTFYINDQAVTQVNDSDYPSGEVGFVVQTLDETLAHIHYDWLTIREFE